MTDPIYGDNPISAGDTWDRTMRPPLVPDAETQAWKAVVASSFDDVAESNWSVMWRTKSVTTAVGIHLDARAADLGILRPAGWDDDRFRAVLVPIDGAAFGRRTTGVTLALAAGLVDGAQTFAVSKADPLTYVVFFFGLAVAEVETYFAVLNIGRPHGVRFVLVYSPELEPDVFTLDDSLLDGPDILAATFT